jgi:hypothetical protein
MGVRNFHKIGGSEVVVDKHQIAGSDIYVLEVSCKSSLDYSSVVMNLTRDELDKIILFLDKCR